MLKFSSFISVTMNATSPLEYDRVTSVQEVSVTISSSSSLTGALSLVSDDVMQSFMAVYRWLGIALCVLPLTFCLLNAGVYWQHRRSSHVVHLLAICAGDGICVLMSFAAFLTALWQPAGSQTYQIVSWYLASYTANSCRRAAICLNLLVTLERFLAISFPLKDFSRRVAGKPRLTVSVVFLLSFAAHAYFLLEYHVATTPAGVWKTLRTSLSVNNSDIFLGWAIVVTVFFSCFPLLIAMALNLGLMAALRKHRLSTKAMRVSAGGAKLGQVQPPDCLKRATDSQGISAEFSSSFPEKPGSFKGIPQGPGQSSEPRKCGRDGESVTTMVTVFSLVYAAMVLPRMLHFSARAVMPEYGPSRGQHNLYSLIDILTQIWAHLTEVEQFCLSCIYSRQFRKGVCRLVVVRFFAGSVFSKQPGSSSVTTSYSSYI